MKAAKSYIIWMPKNGIGKLRQVIIEPKYLVVLAIALAACVLLIPFLQSHIFKLNNKIANLENKKETLESEISSLKYLKQNLARIENKDRQLSKYFGIEKEDETLDGLLGKGGAPDMLEYLDDYPADSYLPGHLNTLENNFDKFEKLLETKELIQDFKCERIFTKQLENKSNQQVE